MKEIPLTRGHVAIVDDEDYEVLSIFKWHALVKSLPNGRREIYAVRVTSRRESPRRTIYMHKQILSCSGQGDHQDGNGLNNCRYNLRPATATQNQANRTKPRGNNSSLFKGVSLDKRRGTWQVRLGVQGKTFHVASCKDELDAATIYNFAAFEQWGEFARFNAPLETAAAKATRIQSGN